jgi:hypothetical protein
MCLTHAKGLSVNRAGTISKGAAIGKTKFYLVCRLLS